MPTIEERIEAMQHAISIMQTEHTSDIKQLYDRVNALQQQVTEQRNRLAEHGQSIQGIQQRSDGLITLLSQQFKTIDTHFTKIDQWMGSIKEGLDETRLYAGMTKGIVDAQEADIRVLKRDVGIIKEDVSGIKGRLDQMDQRFIAMDQRFDQVDQRFVSLEGKFDQRFTAMDQRFTSLEGKFDQMLQLLTKGQKS